MWRYMHFAINFVRVFGTLVRRVPATALSLVHLITCVSASPHLIPTPSHTQSSNMSPTLSVKGKESGTARILGSGTSGEIMTWVELAHE